VRPLRALVIAAAFCPAVLASQQRESAAPASRPTAVAAAPSAKAAAAFVPGGLARVDTWLQQLIADGKIPGAVVMLVHDGQVAYHRAYGVRDVGTRVPLQATDIFRIASQTKAVTALAAMMLWEEGRFQLDEPIGKYLPAFKEHTVLTKFNAADSSYEAKPTRRRITVRQLLTHTSGLDYPAIGSDEFKAIYAKAGIPAIVLDGAVLADKMDRLAQLPLKHEPGERFTYGLSYDVLGRLVEVWSGMPLDRFVRTRILEPLGMRDTYFEVPAEKRSRVVALHTLKDDKLVASHEMIEGLHPDFPIRPVTYFSGGGGLSSTTADYARFLQLFLNGGELDGTRLLGRKTVEMMLTNQMGSLQPALGLGFGLETADNDYRSPMSVGSFAWGGAFNTTYWADPKEHLVALIYTSTWQGPVSLEPQFKTFVYAALR
jgi:CubicO group peptidase (beta-lactamase class C family)